MPQWVSLFEELGKADSGVSGHELDGRRTAKVVRVQGGERLVTDGPFAETKEILGGVFLIDLPDLDEAIRLAALVPAAERGSVEIRPIVGVTVEQAFREEWGHAVGDPHARSRRPRARRGRCAGRVRDGARALAA